MCFYSILLLNILFMVIFNQTGSFYKDTHMKNFLDDILLLTKAFIVSKYIST